ncbi:hypothetical protein WJS89_08360 [Sphingomicrobium sp. XHP0235]|uniref:hypothetical protein n=1 Tax=Sphingomicrobium aquimarinum TaxID=3133971 RepID=UPI0031FF13F9
MPAPEPELTAHRFKRLRRTLKRMALLSLAIGVAAVAYVVSIDASPSIHLVIATFILAGGTMLTATFLMTLLYFSAQAGYDADAHDANPLHADKDSELP